MRVLGEIRIGPVLAICFSRLHIALPHLPFPQRSDLHRIALPVKLSSRPDPEYPLHFPAPKHLSSAPSFPTRAAGLSFDISYTLLPFGEASLLHPLITPSTYTSFFVGYLSNITFFTLHDHQPSQPSSPSQAPDFPLPSSASTSRFYWEVLVYIIDQIKQKEKQKQFS